MTRFSILAPLLLLMGVSPVWGQVKYEREFRIRQDQFPQAAFAKVESYLEDVRRLRFYKEIDSNRSSYEIKFKKDRLHYSVEFDTLGALEDVEVRVKPIDIPDSTWEVIQQDLSARFERFKVRKIQQQYPRAAFDSDAQTMRNAFQNLLLPGRRYELVIQARTDSGYREFEALYDSEGVLLKMRKSLPPNYDHVLY